MLAPSGADQERRARLKEFRIATRVMGEEAERLGLTEEDAEAKVEAVRQRLFEECQSKYVNVAEDMES